MLCSASRLRSRAVLLLIAGLPLLVAACHDRQDTPTAASMPPVPVLVETVSTTAVPDVVELPGRIEAVRSAEIRARVDGIVERTLYQEGPVTAMLDPLELIEKFAGRKDLAEGTLMFCGTLAVHDGITPSETFEMELEDPVLGRKITHLYHVKTLPDQG